MRRHGRILKAARAYKHALARQAREVTMPLHRAIVPANKTVIELQPDPDPIRESGLPDVLDYANPTICQLNDLVQVWELPQFR
jgi:hypothetical protein